MPTLTVFGSLDDHFEDPASMAEHTAAELRGEMAAARAEGSVPVTTAKDSVKLPRDLELWVVDARMEPVAGDWSELWSLVPEALA